MNNNINLKINNKKNFDNVIDSKEFKVKVSELLTSLLRRTKSSDNEATTASYFENEIYYFVRNTFGISLDFRKEESQSTLRHKFVGRMDAVCNNLVVEYKKRGKLNNLKDIDTATKQLSNYLKQLLREDNTEYYGVLTDGIKIKYVYFQNGEIHSTSLKNINEYDLDKLIHSLLDTGNKRFVPKNIVDDFKLNSQTSVSAKLAKYLFRSLIEKKSPKTSMLFQEWEVLFHLSENDKGQNEDIGKRRIALGKLFDTNIQDMETDYKALFALQTTYAIIVKLIATKVITKIEFNKDIEYFSDLTNMDYSTLRQFIEYIEDGYVFQTGGVRNLLEGDFFSWYCAEDIWNDEEAKIFLEIINILESYSSNTYKHGYSTVDIFIDLYIEIIPQEVRHSLGEYFTPSWLADKVVKESKKFIHKDDYVAVDPTCGSGVFVISVIKDIIGNVDLLSLNNNSRRDILNSILNRVKGVDINPLAVLTAKVGFYLSIKPLINGEDIEIPIYLGDSANIPNKKIHNNIECYSYVVTTKQENINVVLPVSFVENKNFFSTMGQIQAIIKTEDEELVFQKFIDNIDKNSLNDEIENLIKTLSSQLVRLHKNKWDGIWIRIVANFMLVGRISEIDMIIGNPPWVKWEFLPQEYANKIKSLCIDRHLFSGQTYMGAISLNICALIANVTASNWLKKNGVLAFLMPQTLMTQDSYAGFRNFYVNYETKERLYLQRLDDWTKSGNPFIDTQEKFMTYYYQYKFVDYNKKGIPITRYTKKRGCSINEINSKHSFIEVEKFFEISKLMAFQMDFERTGYTTFEKEFLLYKNNFDLIIGECDYKARSGVEFTPAEVYFIEPIKSVANKDLYKFKPSEFKNSKYKSITNLPVALETKFIKPVIKAPTIIPFGFKPNNNYCIFPYKDNQSKSISISDLSKESNELLKYLTNNKKLISKQSKRSLTISRGNAFYSLSKVGDYTFAPHKVIFRDNTKLSAAVVNKIKTPWSKKIMPICAKHGPYISMDKNNRPIAEDEAYYLCGILNTPIVAQYFKFTYSGRSYSINFNIKMPLYNKNNIYHTKIMKLARKATLTKPTDEIYKELENNYLELCKEI